MEHTSPRFELTGTDIWDPSFQPWPHHATCVYHLGPAIVIVNLHTYEWMYTPEYEVYIFDNRIYIYYECTEFYIGCVRTPPVVWGSYSSTTGTTRQGAAIKGWHCDSLHLYCIPLFPSKAESKTIKTKNNTCTSELKQYFVYVCVYFEKGLCRKAWLTRRGE